MKEWTLHIGLMDGLLYVSLMLIAWLLQHFVLKRVFEWISGRLEQKLYFNHAFVLRSISPSFRYAIVTIGVFFGLSFLLKTPFWEQETMIKALKSMMFLHLFGAFYRTFSFYAKNPNVLEPVMKEHSQSVLFPFFCRVMMVLSSFITFALISLEWGYDLNGFVAGLGIGGIALALGAKDILSNIFGGMAIAFDKPFSIGDSISTENQRLEGIVEDINFRSTRIRTPDKAVVFVPNALLANQAIYNFSRRDNRRVRFFLGVSLDTKEYTLRTLIHRISEEICSHQGVDAETASVFIDEYAQTSINLLIVYFTNTGSYTESMQTKQDINLAIKRILQEEQVSLSPASHHIQWNKPL